MARMFCSFTEMVCELICMGMYVCESFVHLYVNMYGYEWIDMTMGVECGGMWMCVHE